MDISKKSDIINDFKTLAEEYNAVPRFKRHFKTESFKKELSNILKKYEINEEMLLKNMLAAGKLNLAEGCAEHISFLINMIGSAQVGIFKFLSLILIEDSEYKIDKGFVAQFCSMEEALEDTNGVSQPSASTKYQKLWDNAGIPCLLESLILLISAEEEKVYVHNNRWPVSPCCWIAAAENTIKLADMALFALSKDSLYSGIPLQVIIQNIKDRADKTRVISHEAAKTYSNYSEINGAPSGSSSSYAPYPGRVQLAGTMYNQLDYVQKLRTIINETQSIAIFRQYMETSI